MKLPEVNRILFLTGPEQTELRETALRRPGPGELLVRIEAATTCGTDLKVFLRGGHPRMLEVPGPFGHEMSGTVVECGRDVDEWVDGDQVVVVNSASCGECGPCREGRENLCEDLHYLNGAYADYQIVPESFVRRSTYRRPAGLDPVMAAMTEPLACVLHGLSLCQITEAMEVAVFGAGPIGLMFVAELVSCGCRVVLGDLDSGRLDVGRRIGAEAVVPMEGDCEDAERIRALTEDGRGAELTVEATGTTLGWQNAMNTARPGGSALMFGGCPPGTEVVCDSHRLHYSEITFRGAYHHRPATVSMALERLVHRDSDLGLLIQDEGSLSGVEGALRRMAAREILKAAIRPHDD
jgi:L-iditol 2-dehydrogenase